MSTQTTNPTSTIVLRGNGPRITVRSTSGAKVTVVNGTKVNTLDLSPTANVEFSAA